ncbi:hypothetical protein IAR55_002080 [Kwoniella newhampshirensis]|uniref:BTB domain-containing protein n=1 Tax=Kwoniella newhampshirensis TaxID=1651941 RepID=A0AAW0Z1I9_9TREE
MPPTSSKYRPEKTFDPHKGQPLGGNTLFTFTFSPPPITNNDKLQLDQIESKNQPTPDEVYNDRNADFTLISSDSVSFKIHKYHLLSESTVFRDMLSVPRFSLRVPTVTLTDPTFETARVLRLFLDFLQKRSPPEPSPEVLVTLRLLIRFVDKYDCQLVSYALRFYSKKLFSVKSIGCDSLFILGSNLGDIEYCAEAIRNGKHLVWQPASSNSEFSEQWTTPEEQRLGTIGPEYEGASMFDVRTWTVSNIAKIPPKFLAALMRASLRVDAQKWENADIKPDDWEVMAKEFIRLMRYEQVRMGD